MMSQTVLDPWEVSETDFPADGQLADKLAFLLNYAVLAPSGHNTQPWRFKVTPSAVELYADRSMALPVVDPDQRELTMSCGAALFNLRIAMRYFGFKDEVTFLPDPKQLDFLARIRLGHPYTPTTEEQRLFAVIPQRRTNRHAFDDRPLPELLLEELKMAATQEGAWLATIERQDVRAAIADLVAEGDRLQWADERFRRELASWTHPNRSLRRDGIPGYAQGVSDLASYAGPLVIRTFDLGKGQAAQDRDLTVNSNALVVLGTLNDGVANWLMAGQALERVLLHARAAGVWASFLNQPVQVAALRPRLGDLLTEVGYPHTVLRLGYGPDVKPTPRRMLDEVVD